MFSRILTFAIAAATLAAAAPTLAYEPTGPSPDDPAAATWTTPKAQLKCDRGGPSRDDPSAVAWVAPPHANKRGDAPADDPSAGRAVAKAEK